MSTVRFERKGDMLNYVYLAPNSGTASTAVGDWTDVIGIRSNNMSDEPIAPTFRISRISGGVVPHISASP